MTEMEYNIHNYMYSEMYKIKRYVFIPSYIIHTSHDSLHVIHLLWQRSESLTTSLSCVKCSERRCEPFVAIHNLTTDGTNFQTLDL